MSPNAVTSAVINIDGRRSAAPRSAVSAFHGSRFLTGREAAEGEAEEGPSGEGGGHYLIDYLIEFAIT